MNVIERTFAYLMDGANWQGSGGILVRLLEHLSVTALATACAALIVVPLGLWAAHHRPSDGANRRRSNLLMSAVAATRALPALGLLTILALWLGVSTLPALIVLIIIAAAPLLAGVLEGLAAVPEDLVDAARAQGLTEWQILTGLEIPLAANMMLGGLRSALVQVIATATIVAYLSGGTLGRYLFDGLAVRDYPRMLVATLLVALLAFAVDALMGLVQRALTPRGSPSTGRRHEPMNQTHQTSMRRTVSRRVALTAAGALGMAGILSACGLSGDKVFSGEHEGIIVGSAAFAESQILAEIYAGALARAGFNARTQLSIGAREAYLGALASGAVDVIPDYSGNLLLYLDPKATANTAQEILQALPAALGTLTTGGSGAEIRALNASEAEDKDSLVVTAQTAQKYGLRSLEDLASRCTNLKLGAAPEFAERAYGIPGLKEKYGCVPAEFVPLSDGGGALTVKALLDDTVQVVDLYSTTPAIEQNQLVVLEDPKNMILAQQVLPIINTSRVPDSAAEVLNRVSAKLTTADLRTLNDRVSGTSKQEPAQAAAAWLNEHGF